ANRYGDSLISMVHDYGPILVLGAGSWGTALAILLARNGQEVKLWGRDQKKIELYAKQRVNDRYLPDIVFPKRLKLYSDLSAAMNDVTDVLFAVPSFAFRSTLIRVLPYFTAETRIILAVKGMDPESGDLLHQVVITICQRPITLAV